VQAPRVDAAHAAHDDRGLGRSTQYKRVELLTAGLGVLLRVVESRERAPVGERQLLDVEEDRGGDERPGETAAARLVRAGYVAALERAVIGEEPPARSAAALRACRCGLGASR
jgi:hypothetical protein